MSATVEWWKTPPLDPADEPLVNAYVLAGRFLDDLPYTEEFDSICARLALPTTNEARHDVWLRLMKLRKMGRLPRLSDGVQPLARQKP